MTRTRISRLLNVLNEKELDAYLVTSMPGVRYLTGFSGSNAVCIVTGNRVNFLTDPRYALQSKTEVRGARRLIARGGLFEEAAKRRLLHRSKRVGFESNNVTYAQYRSLKRLFPSVSFVPTADTIDSLAVVKDRDEVHRIRKAVEVSDKVFSKVVGILKPGITELDLAAEISYLHKKNGAERDAFETIVASGVRGSLPHARATAKRIQRGEMVTFDFGCSVDGYNSDITRTVAVGNIPRRMRDMYRVVLEAQLEAIASARSGMWARDLDAVARKRIAASGYGKFFIHSLGHGLGLQVHEKPRISALSKERLVAGNVITIEPGVYVPDVGGVRIEDDVLLTRNGCEVLSKSPKELLIV